MSKRSLVGNYVGIPVSFFGVHVHGARYLAKVAGLHPRGVWLKYPGWPGYCNWVTLEQVHSWLISEQDAANPALWYIDPPASEDEDQAEEDPPSSEDGADDSEELSTMYCCAECGKRCGNAGGLATHMKKLHGTSMLAVDSDVVASEAGALPDAALVAAMAAHLKRADVRVTKVASCLGVTTSALQAWISSSSDGSVAPWQSRVRAYLDSRQQADTDATGPGSPAIRCGEEPLSGELAELAPRQARARPKVEEYDDETQRLVERLLDHMKRGKLSQAVVAAQARVSSGPKLSAWLHMQLPPSASREEVERKVHAYLEREESHESAQLGDVPQGARVFGHVEIDSGSCMQLHLQSRAASSGAMPMPGITEVDRAAMEAEATERRELGARLAAIMKDESISQMAVASAAGVIGGIPHRTSNWVLGLRPLSLSYCPLSPCRTLSPSIDSLADGLRRPPTNQRVATLGRIRQASSGDSRRAVQSHRHSAAHTPCGSQSVIRVV